MHRPDRPVAGRGGEHRPERPGRGPEAQFLALEIADILHDGEAGESLGRCAFKGDRAADLDQQEQQHHAEYHPGMFHPTDDMAEHPDAGHRNEDDRNHLQAIGPEIGILQRVGGIGAEKPAAIGTQLLDRDKGGRRPAGDRLGHPFQSGGARRAIKGHRHAAHGNETADDDRQRQEHPYRCALHVEEEIAHARLSANPACQSDQRRDARCGGYKLQPHQPAKLRQIAPGAFSRIMLEIGIGGKGRRGVEHEVERGRALSVRIERQQMLGGQQQKDEAEHQQVEGQQRDRILFPVLLGRTADSAGKQAVDPGEAPGKQRGHIFAERPGQQRATAQDQDYGEYGWEHFYSFPLRRGRGRPRPCR